MVRPSPRNPADTVGRGRRARCCGHGPWLVLSTASECELRGWMPTGTPPPPGMDVHTLESTLVLSSDSIFPGHVEHHRPYGKVQHTNTQIPQNNQCITMNTNQRHLTWTLARTWGGTLPSPRGRSGSVFQQSLAHLPGPTACPGPSLPPRTHIPVLAVTALASPSFLLETGW